LGQWGLDFSSHSRRIGNFQVFLNIQQYCLKLYPFRGF
jgi:hypothetical protein